MSLLLLFQLDLSASVLVTTGVSLEDTCAKDRFHFTLPSVDPFDETSPRDRFHFTAPSTDPFDDTSSKDRLHFTVPQDQ